MHGKNVSKTGDKLSWPDEKAFADRFADSQELEKLCIHLWEAAKSPSGKQDRKFLDLFELSIVGSGLILASNRQSVIDLEVETSVTRQDGETAEEFVDRKDAFRAMLMADDSTIRLDWDLVKSVLKSLAESNDNSGPFEKVFKDLFERQAKDKRSDKFTALLYSKLSISSMSAFVQLLKNIMGVDGGCVDAAGIESSVWTSYRIVDNKAPTTYRDFGGLDIGYKKSSKASKDNDE
jgi:hypothetical protein